MEGARGKLATMRTDQELLADYAATGSEPAFAELVARHGRMVYRTCLRSLGSEHDAEEVAQAVFLVLVQKRRALRSEGELAAWLHRVAKNAAHLAARSRARRARHEEAAAMVRETAQSAQPAPEGREALASLDRELDGLPAVQRQAVLLRYLEGRGQEEAAHLAGCPQGTLARRAQLGLERLRERLAQRGNVLAVSGLAALLGAEAGAAAPASLLPSILAASKLAAAGTAAGATGGTATMLAKGVVKMMFWAKLKMAAAVTAAVLAVGGVGGAVAGKMLAGEPAGPEVPPPGRAEPPAAEAGGEAVNGLKLTLASARQEVRLSPRPNAPGSASPWPGINPGINLTLTLTNAGSAPLKLDLSDPRNLVTTVAGPADGFLAHVRKAPLVPKPPTEDMYPTLKPGEAKKLPEGFPRSYGDQQSEYYSEQVTKPGEYRIKFVYTVKEPGNAQDFQKGAWTGTAASNEVTIKVLPPEGAVTEKPAGGEAVDGLKFTISADKLEAKAGDAVNIDVRFENVSKENFRILRYWGQVSWELVAPDGESLLSAPTAMPGLAGPTLQNYPEIKAGGNLSWQEKAISGNPPQVYVGPGINPRNVYLVKPGTYKLTAVYALKEGQGQGVAAGKVWAGTARSNTLELKLGGEFKAPANPGQWPPKGIPGVTPPQKGQGAGEPAQPAAGK